MSNVPIAPVKPGLHSYNLNRRLSPKGSRPPILRYLNIFLVLLGLSGVGYYGYTLADEHIYQAYQNWAFDRHMGGHAATFADWLRARTPLGTFMKPAPSTSEAISKAPPPQMSTEPIAPVLEEGALLGRVSINRLNLSAMVRQGVEEDTLRRAVGHVPSTALPGQSGNFAIAAHRDTLFRGLKDIKQGDQVTFQSTSGNYTYQVVSTQIVLPSNVSVLRPPADGGWLTMITCYPFYYVGSAPKRFIVQAKLISTEIGSPPQGEVETSSRRPTQAPSPPRPKAAAIKHKFVKQASLKKPRPMRGFSGLRRVTNRAEPVAPPVHSSDRKQGFWRRLFHRASGS